MAQPKPESQSNCPGCPGCSKACATPETPPSFAKLDRDSVKLLADFARGALSGGWGPGSNFRREMLQFTLQPAHLLKRPFSQNGELLRLSREQFAAQRGERLVHALQLLDRLGQDGIGLVHRRTSS